MTNLALLVSMSVAFLIGLGAGWAARSFKFGLDHDCANPDHEK